MHRQLKKSCLKAIHFPHRAGYWLSNASHTERDAENQAARSCWLCTQLNCMTTWLSPRQLPSATHRSGLLAAFGIWREWQNINENKTIEEKNQRFNNFRKKKIKSSSLSTTKWDSKRVRSHYQPNLTQAELQTKHGYVEVPQKSSKPTSQTQERE